jgi:hypothetical protein
MISSDKQGWVRLLPGDTSEGDTSFIASSRRAVAVGRDGQSIDIRVNLFCIFFWAG